jgi:hypothetical protein
MSVKRVKICRACQHRFFPSLWESQCRDCGSCLTNLLNVTYFIFLTAGAAGGFWFANFLDPQYEFLAGCFAIVGGACGLMALFMLVFWLDAISKQLSAKWAGRATSGLACLLFSAPVLLAILIAVPVLIMVFFVLAGLAIALWPLTIIFLLLVIIAKK